MCLLPLELPVSGQRSPQAEKAERPCGKDCCRIPVCPDRPSCSTLPSSVYQSGVRSLIRSVARWLSTERQILGMSVNGTWLAGGQLSADKAKLAYFVLLPSSSHLLHVHLLPQLHTTQRNPPWRSVEVDGRLRHLSICLYQQPPRGMPCEEAKARLSARHWKRDSSNKPKVKR
jgi:hypothetical protein